MGWGGVKWVSLSGFGDYWTLYIVHILIISLWAPQTSGVLHGGIYHECGV